MEVGVKSSSLQFGDCYSRSLKAMDDCVWSCKDLVLIVRWVELKSIVFFLYFVKGITVRVTWDLKMRKKSMSVGGDCSWGQGQIEGLVSSSDKKQNLHFSCIELVEKIWYKSKQNVLY